MSTILFATLATIAAGAILFATWRSARKNWCWYESLTHSEIRPSARLCASLWVTSMILFAVGIWVLTTGETQPNDWILGLTILSLLGAWRWPIRLFSKRDLRNSFTLACTEWVLIALTVAAASVIAPIAGALMVPLALTLTAGGFYNFVVWQLN